MIFLHRLGYYLGGVGIGIVLLAFFLGGKKTSCAYGPNSRVLKNIQSKKRIVSPEVVEKLKRNALDTVIISKLLQQGQVNFSASQPRKTPCGLYRIDGKQEQSIYSIWAENCEEAVKITKFIQKGS